MRLTALSILLVSGCLGAAEAAGAGDARYLVDSGQSWIRVLVFRGGLLSGLGHNHVVSVDQLRGEIAAGESADDVAARLAFDVQDLQVDDPRLRAAEGGEFATPLSSKDIRGTRQNMLGGKLLAAHDFRSITVELRELTAQTGQSTARVAVGILGQSRQLELPVTVSQSASMIIVTGSASVLHEQLGLTPFRAALGALKVREELTLRYRIVARLAAPVP